MKLRSITILLSTIAVTIFVFASPETKPSPLAAADATPGGAAGDGYIAATDAAPTAGRTSRSSGAIGASDSSIIARVGESDVSLDEVRTALTKLSVTEQAAIAKDPALLNQVVRLLLVQRLMLNEARAKKWDERPEVRAAIERARETTIAESYLQAMSAPPADYPSESELAQAYKIAKPKLSAPKQWRLAQIYLALPEGASKEESDRVQSRLDSLKKQLASKDADFGAIAKKESDDAVSAAAGGEIGWLTEELVQPEIRTDVAILGAGAVSPALRMKDGWHIVKCLEVREATTVAFEDVRGALTDQLRKEKTWSNSQSWMAKLVQENPLAINEIALAKMLEDARK
jgi:parvulin-like peptidyl-prolyl isomerase